MAKKVKKKHNPLKGMIRRATARMFNRSIVYIQGLPCSYFYNHKTRLIERQTDHILADNIMNRKHKWNILIATCCVNINGNRKEEYFKQEQIIFAEPIHQMDTMDILTENHKRLIGETNEKHYLRFAWIAYPADTEFSDDITYDIFKRMRAFEPELLKEEVPK